MSPGSHFHVSTLWPFLSQSNTRSTGESALEDRQGQSRHIPDWRSGNISRNGGADAKRLNKCARGRKKAVLVIRERGGTFTF